MPLDQGAVATVSYQGIGSASEVAVVVSLAAIKEGVGSIGHE